MIWKFMRTIERLSPGHMATRLIDFVAFSNVRGALEFCSYGSLPAELDHVIHTQTYGHIGFVNRVQAGEKSILTNR
jgi:hypothetical protein